jgi:hypothetical protein
VLLLVLLALLHGLLALLALLLGAAAFLLRLVTTLILASHLSALLLVVSGALLAATLARLLLLLVLLVFLVLLLRLTGLLLSHCFLRDAASCRIDGCASAMPSARMPLECLAGGRCVAPGRYQGSRIYKDAAPFYMTVLIIRR